MEKPMVQVGQRWRYNEAHFVVAERREEDDGWIIDATGVHRPFGDRYWMLDSQFRSSCTYLGIGTPSAPARDSNECGCGHAGCRTCDPHKPMCSCDPCVRDRGPVAASPPKPQGISFQHPSGCQCDHCKANRPKPVYGRFVDVELCAKDGTPLTALQRIQAKKEPEPWVPSCDELHWLEDA